MSDTSTSAGGVGLGSIVAVILSVALNHSVGWAIFHFLCGWIYVIYAAIARSNEILPALHKMFGA